MATFDSLILDPVKVWFELVPVGILEKTFPNCVDDNIFPEPEQAAFYSTHAVPAHSPWSWRRPSPQSGHFSYSDAQISLLGEK